MRLRALRAAIPYTLPVFMGYLFLGMAFGVLLVSQGLPVWLAPLMSLTMYAGSGQFVAIGLLTGAFRPLEAAVVTLSLNARHLFYGLSLLERFGKRGPRRAYQIFSLTDETYSLLCAVRPPQGVDEGWFDFFLALLDQSYWLLGSLLGAAAGALLTFDSTGVDFAMTALFLVIFTEQWEKARSKAPALLGAGISLACLLLVGKDGFIPFAMAGILLALTLLRGRLEERAVSRA